MQKTQRKWGGKRTNSGRKRLHSKGVAHREREHLNSRVPLHINFRFKRSVRNKDTLKLLKKSIQNARSHGLRIIQFSFLSNHVHLIVEATSNHILTKGMRSLTITFAKGLGKGGIQTGRYHLHVLRSLREVKNALIYVLFNQQKHEKGTCSTIDGYTSLLSMERGMELIQNFAKEKKMTLKIDMEGYWHGDRPGSYLYKEGLSRLF